MIDEPNSPRVAVVGQGLLGRGIAACLLRHGFTVVALERSDAELNAARDAIGEMIKELVVAGLTNSGLQAAWSNRYVGQKDYSVLAGCAFVIESVNEDLAGKTEVLERIEAEVEPEIIIASNTSAIPITQLQRGRRHPGRFVGMHWAEPAHITRFMELVRGEETTEAAFQTAASFARQMGKDVCACQKDIPGFIVNRLAYAMYREADFLLHNGVADADTIDRAMRNALGLWASMCGPLRWIDLTGGPELYAKAMQPVLPTLARNEKLSPVLEQLAASGAQGIRNGRGFFNYTPEEARQWAERYREHAWRMVKLQEEYFPVNKAPTA